MADPKAYERAIVAGRKAWGGQWNPSDRVASAGQTRATRESHRLQRWSRPRSRDRPRYVLPSCVRVPSGGYLLSLSDTAAAPEHLIPEELCGWRNEGSIPAPMDYVRGVIATAVARGVSVRQSIELAVAGDVPIGLGLSSSASLCVALTLALHVPATYGRELVLRAQEAEHRAGTPCGTMDQSASVGGDVILYDGQMASWSPVTPELGSFAFAVADSGVTRSLATSSYPRRVEESREALLRANQLLGANYTALAELNENDLSYIEKLADEGVSWRAEAKGSPYRLGNYARYAGGRGAESWRLASVWSADDRIRPFFRARL